MRHRRVSNTKHMGPVGIEFPGSGFKRDGGQKKRQKLKDDAFCYYVINFPGIFAYS